MGILDKLEKAKAATGGGGNRQAFSSQQGLWIRLENGDNEVRLGGNVAVCNRHYVKELVSAESLKSSGEGRPAVNANATCMNWDIEGQEKSEEELHCCPVCDLRVAANMKRQEAKDAGDEEQEKKMKELSGKSYARARYSWDAISRADPIIETKDAEGNTEKNPGWKILNIGKECTEALEALANQYPQLADPEEGCDVVISRHKSNRITYGASFALDGVNIKVTPLTEEEMAMEKIDLIRYVANHISPRVLFESLKPEHQELITDVLGKSADDYPEECPVKKTSVVKDESSEKSASASKSKPQRKAAPTENVKSRSASVADEFDEIPPKKAAESKDVNNDTFGEEKDDTPPQPKKPSPPKEPATPKPPKEPATPKPPKEPATPKPPKEPEPKSEPEKEPEPEVKDEKDEDVKPSCFGYFDSEDAECSKCGRLEDCKKK